jgi:tetratricopeptide (TPR) repeat protein
VTRVGLSAAGVAFLVAAGGMPSPQAPSTGAPKVELAYFPSGRMLHAASIGFDGLAADFAFLRAVQYYGEHRKSDRDYPWAPHLFHVITELDRRFATPYLFGALVLVEDAGRFELGLDLLRRGMHANPERWELPFEAGFLTLVTGRDRDQAARWLERATRLPGAPDYVARFAAFAYTQAGSREAALRLWRQIAEETTEPGIRETALRYIAKLEGDDGNG